MDLNQVITVIAAVGAVCTMLSSIGALTLGVLNRWKIDKTNEAINEVHLTFNSRMSEFLDLTRKSSKQEGVEEGRADNRLIVEDPLKVEIVKVPPQAQ